jgi:hypothetical protein
MRFVPLQRHTHGLFMPHNRALVDARIRPGSKERPAAIYHGFA